MNQNSEQHMLSFEDPGEETSGKIFTEKAEVSPLDKFKLAKLILIFATLLYVLAAIAYILIPEGTREIWDHAKVLLNSIVTLVIGFYFGSKEK